MTGATRLSYPLHERLLKLTDVMLNCGQGVFNATTENCDCPDGWSTDATQDALSPEFEYCNVQGSTLAPGATTPAAAVPTSTNTIIIIVVSVVSAVVVLVIVIGCCCCRTRRRAKNAKKQQAAEEGRTKLLLAALDRPQGAAPTTTRGASDAAETAAALTGALRSAGLVPAPQSAFQSRLPLPHAPLYFAPGQGMPSRMSYPQTEQYGYAPYGASIEMDAMRTYRPLTTSSPRRVHRAAATVQQERYLQQRSAWEPAYETPVPPLYYRPSPYVAQPAHAREPYGEELSLTYDHNQRGALLEDADVWHLTN